MMKRLFFFFLLIFGSFMTAAAQPCHNSGPSICTPQSQSQPGFNSGSHSFPVLLVGVSDTIIIEFKNFDSIFLNGHQIAIRSLKFDTISNTPWGFCWASSDTNDTFRPLQDGCIKMQGATHVYNGQYKLHIVVDVDTGTASAIKINGDLIGLKYYIRILCDSADPTLPFDTTQTDTNSFIPDPFYCAWGIFERDRSLLNLSVYPNPLNDQSNVGFTAISAGLITEQITDVIGHTIYRKQVEVKSGHNSFLIERNNLLPGVYFYTISDGTSNCMVRLIITD